MLNAKQQVAEQLIKDCSVVTVATIDNMGFPNTTALTPLPHDRSLKQLFFYTGRQTTTIKNILRTNKASLFLFNADNYSSLMLKGSFHLINRNQFPKNWQNDLTHFQISLNYSDPVIVVFHPMAIKLFRNHEVAYFSTDSES